jgi:type II secretory pathway component PulK
MTETFDNKVVDQRVVKRYLRKGIVDEKEYAAFLKALPDLEDQALSVDAAMDGEPTDGVDDAE